jgi:CRP-like cAMP-binding protein
MEPQDVLKLTPFFGAVLDQSELDLLAEGLRVTEFPRGTVLMRQGDTGSSLFVIVAGKAGVTVHSPGGEAAVATLGAGDLVGEMSLMTGARRSATVTASRKLTAVEVTKAALERLLFGNRDLVRRFAEMVEQRQAELASISKGGGALALSRSEIVARMTAFYGG